MTKTASTSHKSEEDSQVREQIVESLAGVGACVDAAAGVIRGVKLIGFESKNGRYYKPDTLRAAVSHYEGVKVNIDHPEGDPGKPRGVRDRLGVIRSARFVDGKGVFGDFHYNPKHALAEQVAWEAEHNPEALGFSHNALLKMGRPKNGKAQVESVISVRSVDLVADPATTRSFYESEEADGKEDTTGGHDDGQGKNPDAGMTPTGRTRDMKDLPDSVFAHVAAGGKKDRTGRTTPRSKRLWPLNNADSVRTALASIPKTKSLTSDERSNAMKRAMAAAKRFKIGSKTSSKEEHDMSDLTSLTLEELRAERPDLVESLTENVATESKESERLKALEQELKTLKDEKAAREREAAIVEELKAVHLNRDDKTHVSDVFWKQLVACESKDDRKSLIEDRAALVKPEQDTGAKHTEDQGYQKPQSGGQGAGGSTVTEQFDPQSFARQLRSRRGFIPAK